MPDQLLLSIRLTNAPQVDVLLRDVAAGLLGQMGYGPAAAAEIVSMLRGALEQNASACRRECDAAFRTEGGDLVIAVSYAGGDEWRLRRRLPSAD